MSDEHESDEHELELQMPFVTTVSHGGPHDDESYVCGWEMGALDVELLAACTFHFLPEPRPIHTSNAMQADLIAMKHGFEIITDRHDDEWTTAVFEHINLPPRNET